MRGKENAKTVAIVPSAGQGKRLGLKTKKPFVLLGGMPLIVRTLSALGSSKRIDAIIVAVQRSCVKDLKKLIEKYRLKKIIDVVIGGKTRFESVKNCLARVGQSFDVVLIHDGARPFVTKSLIEESIILAKRCGGCIVALPESDTVKLADEKLFIAKTLDRQMVFRAQTPQVFRAELIKKAYEIGDRRRRVTDDSFLVEGLRRKVKILRGSSRNIKITTKEDLKLAEVLL